MPRKQKKAPNLTPKQLDVLMLIRDYQQKHGYSPTMQELADILGVTKVTVFEHVGSLERKKLIRRSKHRARSLQLTSHVQFPDEQANTLPLVGHIAAGAPIEAIENPEQIDIGSMYAQHKNAYALKVRGDSMVDEQICDGDIVVIEPREMARNGETVVATLEDGEATLKKFYQEGKRVRLQPANPNYEPIYVTDVRVQGVVVGLMRNY